MSVALQNVFSGKMPTFGRRVPRPKLDLPALRETIPEVLKNGALGYICLSGRNLNVPEDMLHGGVRIGSGEGQSAVYRLIYNGMVIARKVSLQRFLN